MSLAKALADHLAAKLNPVLSDNSDKGEAFVICHGYDFGDTEGGFYPSFEIDPVELEREIDQFIATFQPKAA